jgi:hypothetical protein
MFRYSFEKLIGADAEMSDVAMQQLITENCQLDRKFLISQLNYYLGSSTDSDLVAKSVVLEQCLISALINHLYYALQMLESPKGIHYFGLMHYFHHGADRKTNILRALDSMMLEEGKTLSLDTVVQLVISILESHANGGHFGEGLHTNSYDTFLLQLLFNDCEPRGLFLSTLEEIFRKFPITQLHAANITTCSAAVLEQIQNERVSTSTVAKPQTMGLIVRWLRGPDSDNSLRLDVLSRRMIRDQAKLNLISLCNLVNDFKKGKALVYTPTAEVREEKQFEPHNTLTRQRP